MKIRLERGGYALAVTVLAQQMLQREHEWGAEGHYSGPFHHIHADAIQRPIITMQPIMQEIGVAVMDNRAILRASFE